MQISECRLADTRTAQCAHKHTHIHIRIYDYLQDPLVMQPLLYQASNLGMFQQTVINKEEQSLG